ncbi:MAG: hypothetical protein KY476_26960 [Planctomycetes bacterium]|nr:hypothetical protein [Planctomycetota bacterium]
MRMHSCRECGRPVERRDGLCGFCSPYSGRAEAQSAAPADVEEPSFDFDPSAGMTAVARFANAAEAGYFAHELRSLEQMPVTIAAEESFDALSGYWSTRFLLYVSAEQAMRAATLLEQLVADTDADEPHAVEGSFGYAAEAAGAVPGSRRFERFEQADEFPTPLPWVPIVLTLAAGSAVLWGARRLHDPPRPPAAPINRADTEQWNRLATPGRPWTLPHENGRGTRELWIDADRDLTVIREDADGDGVFEGQRELKMTR